LKKGRGLDVFVPDVVVHAVLGPAVIGIIDVVVPAVVVTFSDLSVKCGVSEETREATIIETKYRFLCR
jgi:hypothetical protein